MEPVYDDYEDFKLDDQQKHQKTKWTTGNRGMSFCRGKGLQLLMAMLLIALLILLIYGLDKSSRMNGSVKGFQSQIQEISQAMVNVSHKTEMTMLKQNIEDQMTNLSSRVLAGVSTKFEDLMPQIMIKMRELAEIMSGELQKAQGNMTDLISKLKMEMSGELQKAQGNMTDLISKLKLEKCQNLQCPNNWIAFKESCYFFSIKEATWHNSQQYCTLHGSNLVVINDEIEQTFISLSSKLDHFWIGLSDWGTEDNWEWVDGTAFNTSATHWGEGEPNNYGNEEDCGQIKSARDWNDANCDSKLHWVCEQKRNLV
ncbi:uncharacterized protein LOC144610680 [Rhinoraja longicauda]